MVWTGLHVAPHATANVFSIRCLISRELASDEACWQRNGRESFRRLHQMAALLRHLGQNLVDGELAAGTAFFFFFSTFPPSLTKCPRPHIHQIHIWFFSHSSVRQPRTASSCHPLSATLRLEFPGILALDFHGTVLGSCCLLGVWFGFLFFFLKSIRSFKVEVGILANRSWGKK